METKIQTVVLLVFLASFALTVMETEAQINYFGVGYSPYVRSDGAAWNSYTVDDIKQMLRIILTNHNSVATYSMGVSRKFLQIIHSDFYEIKS